jgi:hypothetical protein
VHWWLLIHSARSNSESAQGKGKRGWNSSLPPKLVEKLVWVSVISFCKISFPVKHLMPYYAETGRSRPPNRLTFTDTFIVFRTFKFFNYLVPFCPIYWQEKTFFFCAC